MSTWRIFAQTLAKNPISTFAVLCVAAIGVFLGYMTHRTLDVLESPDWCSRAVQAERITPGSEFAGLTTCNELLTIQLQAVANGFLIQNGGFVFVLAVLIVVVVAGARATFKLGREGIEGNVSRDPVSEAADHVVEGAQEAAAEVKGA